MVGYLTSEDSGPEVRDCGGVDAINRNAEERVAHFGVLLREVCWRSSGVARFDSILRIDGGTVSRVDGYHFNGSYTSTSGEAVTFEELGSGIRQLYGALPKGLAGLTS